jgi:hypothetical protein
MMSNHPIVDASGRFLAPPQTAFAPRAAVYTEDGSGEHVSWCPCERCEGERDAARRANRGADVRRVLRGELPIVGRS